MVLPSEMKVHFLVKVSAGGGPGPLSLPNGMSTIARSTSGTLSSESDLAGPVAECFYCGQNARKQHRKRARPEQTSVLRETSPSLSWISEVLPPPNQSLISAGLILLTPYTGVPPPLPQEMVGDPLLLFLSCSPLTWPSRPWSTVS